MKALFDLDWTNPAHIHPVHPLLLDYKLHFQEENQEQPEKTHEKTDNSLQKDDFSYDFDPIDLLNPSLRLSPHSLHLIPQYCHLPLVLDENGKRLAKRAKSKSLRALREEDHLQPEEIWKKMLKKENISKI